MLNNDYINFFSYSVNSRWNKVYECYVCMNTYYFPQPLWPHGFLSSPGRHMHWWFELSHWPFPLQSFPSEPGHPGTSQREPRQPVIWSHAHLFPAQIPCPVHSTLHPRPVKQGSQTQLPLSMGTCVPLVQGSSQAGPIQPDIQLVHVGGFELLLQKPRKRNPSENIKGATSRLAHLEKKMDNFFKLAVRNPS